MDLGFSETMNAIIANLPKSRQTLLFSATQEKSVKDLARLSLKSPEYVTAGDHDTSSNSGEASEYQAPPKLTQVYLVCDLQRKLDILYSFLRTHTKDKILVFMSSCKQVRYVYEAFRNARPGLPLLALHGQQKQAKRMAMYNSYTKKSEACLFATDIAARGLDFPSVNWVIQMDCPEDVATYIHRSGRTARYKADGKALLMLLPSEEEAMLAKITERNIQLQRIKMDEKKLTSCVNHVSNLCAKDADMKHLAQRSFVSYVRSVHLQADKEVFNVGKLPLEEYALSLGLSKAPKIRFVKKIKKHFGAQADRPEAHLSKKEAINVLKQTQKSPDENSDAAGSDGEAEDKGWDVDVDDDDDLLIVNPDQSKVAQLDSEDDAQVAQELEKARKKKEKTKAAKAKKELSKGATNTKVKFIDGEAHTVRGTAPEAADDGYEGGIDIEAVKQKLKEENVKDKAADRERLKQRKRERKIKEKKRLAGSDSEDDGADGPVVVTLGGDDAQEDSEDESHNAAGAESDGEYSDYERPGASRGTKRNRSSGSESSDDDADANNNNNATTDAFSSKRARAMQRDEALALQMLDM
ncbi:hypothetical protein SARC_02374 [Sphaeroforma arctica JP610]|uniref:ATP-dependent RNA helicase n=1 Tax=Sphaeroforma arctica JP610 TaxID=667725 RepID=A0A0L0G8R0_9EUKA|nr:hypothetical protein SARC_02374 [Sphaeroforma arctica JP610]KNC85422.1 hypothetical protein SARC_02374 [Sphaeroforma arctica JP610]|eukprot:XP_014159324.1 hypothetical protein SARC_02374 [Sphaeroforma arctica JP610]